MSDDGRWKLLGIKWGYLHEWSLPQAVTMAVVAGVTIAQGRPWSYIGWTILLFAVATRPKGQKSLLEEATSLL